MKTGLTWKSPSGKTGGFYNCSLTAQREACKVAGDWADKWSKLNALGWSIVSVVVIEIPEPYAYGLCGPCKFLRDAWSCNMGWGQDSEHFCGIEPGPNCPAGKKS